MCCMAGVHYAQYINANSLSLLLLLQPPKLQETEKKTKKNQKKKKKICLKAAINQRFNVILGYKNQVEPFLCLSERICLEIQLHARLDHSAAPRGTTVALGVLQRLQQDRAWMLTAWQPPHSQETALLIHSPNFHWNSNKKENNRSLLCLVIA